MPVSKSTLIDKKPTKSPLRDEISAEDALNEINRGFAEEKARTRAKTSRLTYVDIADTPINADLLSKINAGEATAALALPFFQIGKKIRIALVDPEKSETKKYLEKFRKDGFQVFPAIASQEGLLVKIGEIRVLQPRRPEEFRNENAEADLQNYEEELKNLERLTKEAATISAKESLNRIFVGALRTGASDIHFQPNERKIDLRFRIDGILQKVLEFDRPLGDEIVNQLKYEAKLRLNVASMPQDGRTSFLAEDRKIDVRVATLPTEFGESIVCRLLDSGKKIITLEKLGFDNTALANLKTALGLREGMLLVTGPTGSGKTTTLYTLLASLNNSERKIVTLENPIEYHLANVVQSQINENENYGFADGLKALLRQDPNVLMVGEIRDEDTAETAAQAAMTGHIVLSTVHANSAIETIPRLLDLGVKPFVLAASLQIVVAQRLVRRPCEKCAKQTPLDQKMLARLSKYFAEIKRVNPQAAVSRLPEFLWQPVGCPACGQTGYRGQIAIAESFLVDEKIRELIARKAPADEIGKVARNKQGMLSFAEDGLIKVAAGLTTLAELARVTGLNLII
ncbi:MAG: ATPase, T2SS/T4P/T4SS family [Patescibacteria group bacterium]